MWNLSLLNILLLLLFFLFVIINCYNSRILMPNNDVDTHHFVFPDNCRDMPADFCTSKVENSICNDEKDECYCQKGYVIVRESHKSSCKPLLTDLVCTVDKDCIHVQNSMCHPGAGHCVCPSRSIFVPQLFICRTRYMDQSGSELCRQCQQRGGQCFLYDQSDLRRFHSSNKNREIVGCVCPHRQTSLLGSDDSLTDDSSVMGSNIRNQPSNRDSSSRITRSSNNGICKAQLVDINEACNDHTKRCWSLKAHCRYPFSNNFANGARQRVCMCITGYVAVYQSNLRYYECLPIISPDNHSNKNNRNNGIDTGDRRTNSFATTQTAKDLCSSCQRIQGNCYYANNINEPIGCVCPLELSNQENGAASLVNPCSVNHLKVECMRSSIRLCYLPHSHPPYASLHQAFSLGGDGAKMQVRGANRNTSSGSSQSDARKNPIWSRIGASRLLTTAQFDSNGFLCGEVSLLVTGGSSGIRQSNNKNSGINDDDTVLSIYKISKEVVEYHGLLDILLPSHQLQDNPISMRDRSRVVLSLPFQCRGKLQDNLGLVPTDNDDSSSHETVTSPLQLEMRLLTRTTLQEASVVTSKTPLHLDATLIDSRGFYTDLAVQSCHLANTSSLKALLSVGSKIYERCINQKTHNSSYLLTWQQFFPGIHYRSSVFQLRQFPSLATLSSSGQSSSSIPLDSAIPLDATNMQEMFLHCRISLCKNQAVCHQRMCSVGLEGVQTSTFYRYAKFRLSNSKSDGFIAHPGSSPHNSPTKYLTPRDSHTRIDRDGNTEDGENANNACPYSLCLNQLQAILTSGLLLLLLSLVVVLLLVLVRRQRVLHHLATSHSVAGTVSIPPATNQKAAWSRWWSGWCGSETGRSQTHHKKIHTVSAGNEPTLKHYNLPSYQHSSYYQQNQPSSIALATLATTLNGHHGNTHISNGYHGNFYLLTDSLSSSLDNLYSPAPSNTTSTNYYPCPTFSTPLPHPPVATNTSAAITTTPSDDVPLISQKFPNLNQNQFVVTANSTSPLATVIQQDSRPQVPLHNNQNNNNCNSNNHKKNYLTTIPVVKINNLEPSSNNNDHNNNDSSLPIINKNSTNNLYIPLSNQNQSHSNQLSNQNSKFNCDNQ